MSCCEEGRATVGEASAVTLSSLPEDERGEQEVADKEVWPSLYTALLREEAEEGRDTDACDSEAMKLGELSESNIRAADMSLSSDCLNNAFAPSGDMSAKKQRSRQPRVWVHPSVYVYRW